MFVIRGKNGEMLTSSEIATEGQEITYKTEEEAKKAIKEFERSMPEGFLHIEEIKCMNCGGTHDVIDFYTKDDDYIILCGDCREKLVLGKLQLGKVGRPSMGVTKKVSLTLSEEDWKWFDEQAKGNRSQFLRYLIGQEQSPEGRWSNNAALGYVILGAEKLGYSTDQVEELVRAIYREFDMKTVDEAKEVYNKSSY